ncbi:uncharacterized protein LOC108680526 isoform X1 [Hyalella azteca]|uniref:Uncharacterized protein LOC108680526 isoform X1 n=2 Tax=Hyalella azteca TaxID=294128 RepID=A0A8B7PFD6_HYAAZ|nr:uncharacterized protein LOC108680526 isoform X1 [Hyalella azteca]
MVAKMSTHEGWLRPAGYLEQSQAKLYDDHNVVISYVLRLATSREVHECDVKQVFTHLFRKTINLRMLPEMRDGQLWIRELQHENLDFQTLNDAEVNAVYHDVASYRYNMSVGPAWAVRFLPLSPKHDEYIKRTTMENTGKKLEKLPHVCHIVMSFHHSITDGFTCVRLIRHILMLLNDVIAGNPIDDSEQYARMMDIKKQQLVLEEFERAFEADPKLLQVRAESLLQSIPDALLSKVYPHPSTRPPKMKCLPRILDSKTTAVFVSRCKEEGVTVHTGFSSVIEASIVKVLLDANFIRDTYTIGGLHCIDQRCYFNDVDNAYGDGHGVMDVASEVPKDILDNFWSHAKQYHAKFKDLQVCKNSIEIEVIERMTGHDQLIVIDAQGIDSLPKKTAPYLTTNMRDVTETLSNCGDNVDLLYYDWMSATQELGIDWLSSIHTYNGQLMHTMQYNTQLMDEGLAVRVVDSVFEILRKVVEEPKHK